MENDIYSKGIKKSNLLHKYKTGRHNKEWVFCYDQLAVVIYDKYPKSFVHLLVLPYEISYVDKKKLKYYSANKVTQFRKKHLPSIKKVHRFIRKLMNFLSFSLGIGYWDSSGKYQLGLQAGYHFNPSMDDLHIHIISTDFYYARKNKKHMRSFSPHEFITIDKVESILEKGHKVMNPGHKIINLKKIDH